MAWILRMQGMHGVAPGARVRFISFRNAIRGFIALTAVFSVVVDATPAIELSQPASTDRVFGSRSGLGIDWSRSHTPEELPIPRQPLGVSDALKQASRSASDRTIWVFPAGNSGLALPSGTASYAIYFPELRDHVLAAVALGDRWRRLGLFQPLRRAAPTALQLREKLSLRIIQRANVPTYATTYGTSNAAPTVGGRPGNFEAGISVRWAMTSS